MAKTTKTEATATATVATVQSVDVNAANVARIAELEASLSFMDGELKNRNEITANQSETITSQNDLIDSLNRSLAFFNAKKAHEDYGARIGQLMAKLDNPSTRNRIAVSVKNGTYSESRTGDTEGLTPEEVKCLAWHCKGETLINQSVAHFAKWAENAAVKKAK